MIFLLKYIRYIILTTAVFLAVVIYQVTISQFTNLTRAYTELGQTFAILAAALIYLSLLITPIYFVFPKLPFKPIAIKARRAIGVSAFIFASMHAILEFFKIFGGFANLKYLVGIYSYAFLFGTVALLILTIMAGTSFNFAVKKMGKYWKIIHRFIYLAGFLIVIHIFILGSDFSSIYNSESIMYIIGLMFLLVLEFLRFDSWVVKKYPNVKPKLTAFVLSVLSFLAIISWYLFKGN
ncbi:MAG: ferric reductase-like transmembrane domain-containing protein [Candidatus Doudnabacteria bacterium]